MRLFMYLAPVLLLSVLVLPACSQNDLARLIEPRHHKTPVVQHRPAPRIAPQQRQVVYKPKPRRSVHPVKKSCSYVMRDLSRPDSSRVWCYPSHL